MAPTALHPSILYPNSSPKTLPSSFKLTLPIPNSPKFLLSPLSTSLNHQPLVARTPKSFKLYCSPAEVTTLEAEPEETQVVANKKRKLFVSNWPWTFSAEKLKELFGQCGTVTNIEDKSCREGKGKNYGFVTMATGEEAHAVLDKFNNSEIEGRIISVEFAKKFRKERVYFRERATGHQLYVTNLAWKVRVNHLKEFFAQSMNPVSSRVIYDKRKVAGYGFVSFATMEEAEAALSAFDGKELMGRPVRLTFTKKKGDKTGNESQGEGNSDTQADTGNESQGEDNSETQAEWQ